jgi:hypothetical protein
MADGAASSFEAAFGARLRMRLKNRAEAVEDRFAVSFPPPHPEARAKRASKGEEGVRVLQFPIQDGTSTAPR